jgi:hypothetical protein
MPFMLKQVQHDEGEIAWSIQDVVIPNLFRDNTQRRHCFTLNQVQGDDKDDVISISIGGSKKRHLRAFMSSCEPKKQEGSHKDTKT